jgi:hypothetical protein
MKKINRKSQEKGIRRVHQTATRAGVIIESVNKRLENWGFEALALPDLSQVEEAIAQGWQPPKRKINRVPAKPLDLGTEVELTEVARASFSDMLGREPTDFEGLTIVNVARRGEYHAAPYKFTVESDSGIRFICEKADFTVVKQPE